MCYGKYCKALKDNSLIGNRSGMANIKSSTLDSSDDAFAKLNYENIYFAIPNETKNIKNIVDKFDIFINKKAYQYNISDVLKFENRTVQIALDNQEKTKEYKVYTFKNLNSDVDLKTKISIIFLSTYKYAKFYIVPYVWLFVCLLIFLFNEDFSFAKKMQPLENEVQDEFLKRKKYKNVKSKTLILLFIAIIYGLLFVIFNFSLKNENALDNYINNDKENYKKHKIEILKADEKQSKIEKEKYEKNTVLYFDSTSLDIDMANLANAKMQILNANDVKVGKLIIE